MFEVQRVNTMMMLLISMTVGAERLSKLLVATKIVANITIDLLLAPSKNARLSIILLPQNGRRDTDGQV
jgi:hypothetical protein